ncbi:hypothetical protein FRC01_010651 [Tulasnella sp. 417]|nr:hypothetical protein FRC01_010651 [Tulasnella sp. 417]
MPRTKTQLPKNGLEDDLEDKPIVPSLAMRASLAKFSFPGATTTPTKSKVAGTTSPQRVPKTTPTSGVKRKLSEFIAEDGPEAQSDPTPSTPSTPSSSTRQGTPATRKKNPGYAPPETYAHLKHLEDHVKPNLDSLTDTLLDPSEDWSMPERYNLGLTNMVDRPSLTASELSRAEKIAGVPAFLRKVTRYRPRIVCFIGREIGEAFETAVRQSLKNSGALPSKIGSAKKKSTEKPGSPAASGGVEASTPIPTAQLDRKAAGYITPLLTTPGFGLLPYKLVHTRGEPSHEGDPVSETFFFTAPSTSGRVQSYQLEDRVQLFRVLREQKEAVLSGLIDSSQMTTIPPALYTIEETRTTSRFFIRQGNPEAA